MVSSVDSAHLVNLFHRRWSLPVLAELHRLRGSKLVTLVHRLKASRGAVKQTLADLIRLGLVMRNPGYGHPLRPEYVLTARGIRIAPACAALLEELFLRGLVDVGLKKWSMPVLGALSSLGRGGGRFSALMESLGSLTDRALALTLKDLQRAGLLSRLVLDSYPPTTLYQVTEEGRPIAAAVEQISGFFPRPPQRDQLSARRA
jgi:DNA-binding HxlR family transcriptional regulator